MLMLAIPDIFKSKTLKLSAIETEFSQRRVLCRSISLGL
jgi:hypothetical protein